MSEHTPLGPWIRRFLLEHVVAERNLARNTQHGYRDAFALLTPFVAKMQKSSPRTVSLSSISRPISSVDFSPISSPRVAAKSPPVTNGLPPSVPSPLLWRSIALSTSNGAGRFARSRSRGPARPSFRISRRQRWTHYSPPQIVELRKVGVITRFCCFSITRALEPQRQLSSRSETSISVPLA